jgi:hypothetical protein
LIKKVVKFAFLDINACEVRSRRCCQRRNHGADYTLLALLLLLFRECTVSDGTLSQSRELSDFDASRTKSFRVVPHEIACLHQAPDERLISLAASVLEMKKTHGPRLRAFNPA